MIANGRFIFALALFSAITACGNSDSASDADGEAKAHFDEDAARDNAAADLSGQTFQDVGDTTQCTEDCSGHDAGFKWAQEHEIRDSSDCGGRSRSFIEGCEEYGRQIEERVDEARDNDESTEE